MSRNHNGGSGYLRVPFLAVLVIGLGIAGTVIVMRDRAARSGQIYALDLDSGAQVWQHAFPGVFPSLIVERRTISVLATVGSGCAAGHDVLSRFDASTGRRVSASTSIHTTPHRDVEVAVKSGVVTVRGHPWKARVLDRQPTKAVAVGDLVFVAVTGLWGGKQCND
jgi:outer membrane protein assembly factor BamB